MDSRKTGLQVLAVVIILAMGVGLAAIFILTKSPPDKRTPPEHIQSVEVTTVQPQANNVEIEAMGNVIASHRIMVQPRVSGDIVWINPTLMPGSTIPKGEVFAKIDKTDYILALQQAEADVAAANRHLMEEQGRQEIARREWELVGLADKATDLEKKLALRKPHLKVAQTRLKSAEAQRDRARRDLEQCHIKLSFNAHILTKNIDVGSRVTSATQLADVVSSDSFWVHAKVPVRALPWIEIPTDNINKNGSTVRIEQRIGDRSIVREGTVLRHIAALETSGRMAQILIEIIDPLGLENDQIEPLLLGSFVRSYIKGTPIEDSYLIPRSSLRSGEHLWTVSPEKTLKKAKATVVWGRREKVLISQGLNSGDKLITSMIPLPSEGMKVMIASESTAVETAP